jgi:DNA-directed RNA polymerase subunit RPC12/RpoP
MKRPKHATLTREINLIESCKTKYQCPHCKRHFELCWRVPNTVVRFLCEQCGEEIIVDNAPDRRTP